MKINHDEEYFKDLVDELKDKVDNIDNIKGKIDRVYDLLSNQNILGANKIIENGIENLEDGLVHNFKDNLEEFIKVIASGSNNMVETDEEINKQLRG